MRKRREGFSMIEVVISVVLTSVILTALGGLSYATARQAVTADNMTTRQAASLEAVNRFTSLPYAQLAGAAGCEVVGTPNNQYRRCVTVTTSGASSQVQVVTTPLQRGVPASTVFFIRNAPTSANPLCNGC